MSTTAPRHALPLAVLLAIFCFVALLYWPYTSDDSFITYRYAANAAAGHGLVCNDGERVEGFSNPLWLALLVVGIKLGAEVVVFSKLLGLLCGLGTLLLAFGTIRRLGEGDEAFQPWGLLLLSTSAGLACYSVSGMETPLYALALTVAVYSFTVTGRRGIWLLCLFGLVAAFTRPEGIAVLALLMVLRARRLPQAEAWWYVAAQATALVVVAGGLLARWLYFGDLLPNTFYAKPPGAFGTVSYLSALTYLREYLIQGGGWLWLALLVVALVRPKWRRVSVAAALLVAVQVALVAHARGDWMALSRFLVPVTPVLLALGYATLLRHVSYRPAVVAVLLVVVALNAVQVAETLTAFRAGDYPYNVMAGQPQRLAGEWLREHFPPQTLVATKRIGGVGYYSGMRIVDTLGLTDRRIAMIRYQSETRDEQERRTIADEVFRRRPDVIMLAVMKRWDTIPLDQPPPDVASNLRDVDNALYAGLSAHGYRFVERIPQGGSGEFAVYATQTR